ncbi:MAG: cysteine desulfurase [Candidatus Altiarchaeota archaeon]|nr:cysteine desulfurase [Candidatus Altiarchaeota archaeon]
MDNAATTRVDERVLEAMKPYFTKEFGNPSSLHGFGRAAHEVLEQSRTKIASKIGAHPFEIIFTSGGTESNNLAIKGIAYAQKDKGKHIITTRIEHPSILNPIRWLVKQGYDATYLDVDEYGLVSPDLVAHEIRKDTILVTVGHANNEVGTIQDIEDLGKICSEKKVAFHTDACQSFTKEKIDVTEQHLDLVTLNSHKIHGPKGVGALYVKMGTKIEAVEHGGGHEKRMRSGTENIPSIVGFATASEILGEKEIQYMKNLRDKLISEIQKNIVETKLNGHPTKRLCNNANISFKGVEGESLMLRLDAKGIACSTASACSSKNLEPSYVLTAMGMPVEDTHGALRMVVSHENTKDEITYVVGTLVEEVGKLRAISPIWRG